MRKISLGYWESGYHKIKTIYLGVQNVTLPLNDLEAVTLKLVKYAMQNGVLFAEVDSKIQKDQCFIRDISMVPALFLALSSNFQVLYRV